MKGLHWNIHGMEQGFVCSMGSKEEGFINVSC